MVRRDILTAIEEMSFDELEELRVVIDRTIENYDDDDDEDDIDDDDEDEDEDEPEDEEDDDEIEDEIPPTPPVNIEVDDI